MPRQDVLDAVATGLSFVLRAQAGLFAGRAVLDVKDFAAPEQGIFRMGWIIGFDIPVPSPRRF
ncbi:MAG: hypothetical protein P4N60_04035 [Verrucomicrobiae bacterium]|nr:hypothetical protein [Verrucomicrobiae bacterium]